MKKNEKTVQISVDISRRLRYTVGAKTAVGLTPARAVCLPAGVLCPRFLAQRANGKDLPGKADRLLLPPLRCGKREKVPAPSPFAPGMGRTARRFFLVSRRPFMG